MNDAPEKIDVAELRRRQKSRARIMGAALIGLVMLVYLITMVRVRMGG